MRLAHRKAQQERNAMDSSDVYCFKKTNTDTGTLQVHVLDRRDNFQSFRSQIELLTRTPISATDAAQNFVFGVAGAREGNSIFNRAVFLDVYCLKTTNTGTGRLEVHILYGGDGFQSFRAQTGTLISAADAAENFAFALGDYNNDGISDLYCLKKTNTGTRKLEVHVLNGADGFQSFLVQTDTALNAADAAANFVFDVGVNG